MADIADYQKAYKISERIGQAWGLSADEIETLLGKEDIERVSYVLGIYRALRTIFPTEDQANAWPSKPNEYFGGHSALSVMLQGRLADVRRYLDGQHYDDSYPDKDGERML